MYQYGTDDIEKAMRTVLRVLNRKAIPPDETEELREEFTEIWNDIQAFRSDAAYIDFVNNYIATEHDERQSHDYYPEVDRPEVLCGCGSPTCPLKRGELLPDALVRQGSVMQHRTPEQAVSNAIQSHHQPHVLREADREWWRETGEPISELMDLQARADNLDLQYDVPMP